MRTYQRSYKHNDNRLFQVIKANQENGKKVLYKKAVKERCPTCGCPITYRYPTIKYCFICDKEISVTMK